MKSVSQKQIAEQLSVHQSTVSAILRGNDLNRYPEETRNKVLALAKKLNYRPRHHARLLRGARSRIIGILDFDWSAQQSFLNSVCKQLIEQGYTPLPLNIQNFAPHLDVTYHILTDLQIEGIVVLGYNDRVPLSYFHKLQEQGIPIIVALGIKLPKICQVSVDYSVLFFEITERLLQSGRKNPVLIVLPATRLLPDKETHTDQIIQGFRNALQKFNLDHCKDNIVHGELPLGPSGEFAYREATRWLKQKKRPDAFICRSDLLAAGAIHACHDLQLSVPEDVAITGCNNAAYSAYFACPLTTYKLNTSAIANETVSRILDAVENKIPIPDKQILFAFSWEAVIRKSCGTAQPINP